MIKSINPYKILFVEDDIELRRNYVQHLKRHFSFVFEASDGNEGYSVYKDKRPDIIISDINLPSMSGLDMLKKIREQNHTVKTILLTAYKDIDYLLKASELKLTKYLVKPVSRDELKDALTLCLDELSKFQTTSKKLLRLKDDFIWDYENKELLCDSNIIKLTQKETRILELFFNNINRTLTFDEIIINIWDTFENDKINTLKTTIMNLRKKLPKNLIENIYGIGYKIILK